MLASTTGKHRERHHLGRITADRVNPRLALLAYLVDAHDGLHRHIGPFDVGKFGFQLFLGRIDQQGGLFAEHQLLDLDETEHATMADLAGVDLIDLALVEEGHTVKTLGTAHTGGQGRGARILTDLPLLGAVWREKTADWPVLAAEDGFPGQLRAVPGSDQRRPASPCVPCGPWFGDGEHDGVDEP